MEGSLIKSIFITCVLVSIIFLLGCQNPTKEKKIENQDVKPKVVNTKNQLIKTGLPCKASSPPIKDKSKLKKVLIDNGTITVEMSDEMANKVVNDFIKKKREAFKRCNK